MTAKAAQHADTHLNSSHFHFGVSGSVSWPNPEIRNSVPSTSLFLLLGAKAMVGLQLVPFHS